MSEPNRHLITVETVVRKPADEVWKCWTRPEHIVHWNFASEDWHCPQAVNDLQPGGKFSWTMAARDGSFQFEFSGAYHQVEPLKLITSEMDDGRSIRLEFSSPEAGSTRIVETFEAEGENSLELQRAGWQAILENFRKYTEGN